MNPLGPSQQGGAQDRVHRRTLYHGPHPNTKHAEEDTSGPNDAGTECPEEEHPHVLHLAVPDATPPGWGVHRPARRWDCGRHNTAGPNGVIQPRTLFPSQRLGDGENRGFSSLLFPFVSLLLPF